MIHSLDETELEDFAHGCSESTKAQFSVSNFND